MSKIQSTMKKINLLESRLQKIPKDIEEFVSLSFDISDRIHDILEKENITQKTLAQRLGKRESEISKWLKGTHNFTLETIAKISSVLETRLIYIPTKTKSLVEIKDAISVFEVLYKSKISEESSLNIKLSIPKKCIVYNNNEQVGYVSSEKRIIIKNSDNTTKYKINSSTNLLESDKEFAHDIVF